MNNTYFVTAKDDGGSSHTAQILRACNFAKKSNYKFVNYDGGEFGFKEDEIEGIVAELVESGLTVEVDTLDEMGDILASFMVSGWEV